MSLSVEALDVERLHEMMLGCDEGCFYWGEGRDGMRRDEPQTREERRRYLAGELASNRNDGWTEAAMKKELEELDVEDQQSSEDRRLPSGIRQRPGSARADRHKRLNRRRAEALIAFRRWCKRTGFDPPSVEEYRAILAEAARLSEDRP